MNDSQTLKQIKDDKNSMAQVGDIVSVKAKPLSESDVNPVFSCKPNKTFTKSDAVIADSTSAIRLKKQCVLSKFLWRTAHA